MIAYGLVATFATWAALWSMGETTARLLFGVRCQLVSAAARLPLGLAATVCLLETAGYFLPIRVAAWLLVGPIAYGAIRIARSRSPRVDSWDRAIVASSLVALAVGLAPVAIAHRFTAVALTNNDGTYYITAADWLARVPWAVEYPSWDVVPPSSCLLELVLHTWHWRTGTPNLMAAVSTLSGLESTEALAVVTAVLYACVPCAAIGLARPLGVPRGGVREVAVGLVASVAAAPAFLGFQHMTGHLAAYSLFPMATGAIGSCVRHGGFRRAAYTAVVFGAGVAFFADGAAVLVLVTAAAVAAAGRRVVRSLLRALTATTATAAVAPFTLLRAAHAAWNTVQVRLPRAQTVFPQRGWLPRGPLDYLATVTGVDPWPPWPAEWPPNAQTLLIWTGMLAAVPLFVVGTVRIRSRPGVRSFAALVAVAFVVGAVAAGTHYLRGKVLLTAAAFAVPLCGLGAAELLAGGILRRLVAGVYVVAELAALSELMRPSRFKVVDRPAHDALLTELRKLPSGSLIAFDGLGAPADVVLDSQRAHRAALLSGLRPVQPGLDGGFYLPACRDAPRPDPLPARAYALQRTTSETLTRGTTTLAEWNSFRLLAVDLQPHHGFIAAWAPTHGWMAAEHDPDGRVFRWAEWQARGTLHVVGPAPCARLRGEMRVVHGAAVIVMKIFDAPVFNGQIGADWTAFETRSFGDHDPVVVDFAVVEAAPRPPDPAHAVALSRLALEPAWQCGASVRTHEGEGEVSWPIEFDREIELAIIPDAAAPCSSVSVVVDGDRFASVALTLDGGHPTWRYMNTTVESLNGMLVGSTGPHSAVITRKGGKGGRRWSVSGVVVTPGSCPK